VNPNTILLVVASGFIHSGWNYLAKRSSDKISFLWLSKVVSVLLLLPFFVYFFVTKFNQDWKLSNYLTFGAFGLASGFIHFAYIYFLSKAYKYGDISFTYPIARGVAPFIVTLLSAFFLAEIPSVKGLVGMLLIVVGIGLLVNSKSGLKHQKSLQDKNFTSLLTRKKPLIFAILTAVMIALYIFIDGKGSRNFSPFIFMYVYSLFSTLFLTFSVLRRAKKWTREIKINAKTIVVTGIMMPLSYFLALHAMQLTQLGYVAALRNISVVFASLFGIIKLREPFTALRLSGSLTIFLGALLISIG